MVHTPGQKKHGGFTGNMSKLGGAKRKLALKSDFKHAHAVNPGFKVGAKQAHKKV